MNIDDALVNRLAELSKLEFDNQAKEKIKQDLSNILDLVEKLNQLDTEGVEPLVYMSEELNVLREDKLTGEVSKTDALLNAPDKDSDYIKVPKVIEKA